VVVHTQTLKFVTSCCAEPPHRSANSPAPHRLGYLARRLVRTFRLKHLRARYASIQRSLRPLAVAFRPEQSEFWRHSSYRGRRSDVCIPPPRRTLRKLGSVRSHAIRWSADDDAALNVPRFRSWFEQRTHRYTIPTPFQFNVDLCLEWVAIIQPPSDLRALRFDCCQQPISQPRTKVKESAPTCTSLSTLHWTSG
jgi:hypothetical protein